MENTKEVKLGGDTYRIKKFVPQIACYWVGKLLGDLLSGAGDFIRQLKRDPLTGQMEKESMNDALLREIPGKIDKFLQMSREKSGEFQKDCLSVVELKFESGYHSLLNDEGFLTKEISNPDLFILITHSFMFTVQDFLKPTMLDNLMGLLPEGMLSAKPAKTASKNYSGSPSEKATGSKEKSGTEHIQQPIGSKF